MPELPEVEVVRAGLQRLVVGRRIGGVAVTHPRAIRRHPAGAADFAARLVGARIEAAHRRGKFLWLDLDTGEALLAHLGMSGQFLVQPAEVQAEKHLHVRLALLDVAGLDVAGADGATELRFVDQRTFGGLSVETLVDGGGTPVPAPVAHIARDPMDPAFDVEAFVRGLRRRRSGVKRALLDQTLVSGIGNIYADEALWRARVHYERAAESLRPADARRLLGGAVEVMTAALAAGGTSFDSLYVNVNGSSGYFSRSLDAYGRADLPCSRCGAAIRREPFMNRSSFFCPRCQRRPTARSG